jgi:preprotein translocase subunit SecB
MKKAKEQNSIKLIYTQATNVKYIIDPFENNQLQDIKLDIKHRLLFPQNEDKIFLVEYIVNLKSPNNKFSLDVFFIASFSTLEKITEDFKNSTFVNTSAPAIAFPYIRCFISNFTLNSGIRPIILPAFNFTEVKPVKKSI